MREIKFRAWDESEKRFWFFSLQEILKRRTVYRGSWDEKVLEGPKQQYTGLKDKNGVEIYEGDILTSNVQPFKMVNPIKDGHGVVRFENGMFKLGAISLVTFINKMEVIGNIYENPELLEVQNG